MAQKTLKEPVGLENLDPSYMRDRLNVIVRPVKREKVPEVDGTRYWTNDEDSSKGIPMAAGGH